MPRLFLFLTALLLLVAAAEQADSAAKCPPPFAKLIQNGGYGVSDVQGRLLAGCNEDVPYIPASILKIPTALAALAILGSAYRFQTRFYADSQSNLYIMGFGDPLLTTEEIRMIFQALKERGVTKINAIFIDDSNFVLEHQPPGSEFSDNPYDAPVGPAAVNFSSVPIRVTKQGAVVSGEAQTPTLPIMQELAAGYPPGSYRVNVCSSKECRPDQQMARYTAELFRALQREAGIPGQGMTGIRRVPEDASLLYEHKSTKNLEELLAACLRHSSNFMANLVYLTCGAKQFGYPATWDKAQRAVRQELVKQLSSKTAAAIVQEDGAGLSRSNRVTVRAMLEVLKAFRPYAHLLPKHRGVPAKSGSMKGIHNYAGYLEDGSAYVILLNQSRNTRGQVLELLKTKRFLPRRKRLRSR